MKRLLALALAFAFAAPAAAADSFQFAPPPYPILNLRAVDAQQSNGLTFISQKAGDLDFVAVAMGGARTVKKFDNGGVSLGGGFLFLGGSGEIDTGTVPATKESISLFGMGGDFKPNLYFDVYGEDEDDFSLPIYFGPHINLNFMTGTFSGSGYTATMFTNVLMYGVQFGVQAGLNLGDGVKFVPYLDFSKDMGGSIGTSTTITTSSGFGSGTTSTSQSVGAQPLAMSPGFDLVFRNSGFSLGGASQALSNAGGSGKTKSIIVSLRFNRKFRSICGI